MKILNQLFGFSQKYKYVLFCGVIILLILILNIPTVKEGLTGISEYQYLAPLPKNYLDTAGISDDFLKEVFTKIAKFQIESNPDNTKNKNNNEIENRKNEIVNNMLNSYKSNPYATKEELDFYNTNGYWPYDGFVEKNLRKAIELNAVNGMYDKKPIEDVITNIKKISSNRWIVLSIMGLLSLTKDEEKIKKFQDSDGMKIWNGTIPPPPPSLSQSSEDITPSSLSSIKSLSQTSTNSNVTLNDFLNVCKRATKV
jgi:hypothetical protein